MVNGSIVESKELELDLELRVTPPDPRPSGRESRQEFDFLGRELTPEAKKREKGPRVGSSGRELAQILRKKHALEELPSARLAGLQWQRK